MKRKTVLCALVMALVHAPAAMAWTWPVEGPVLRPFTLGDDPYAAGQHRGVDIGAADGTIVVAPASGTVSFAGTVPAGGKTVTIETADGYAVTLQHLGVVAIAEGAELDEGRAVGEAGTEGHVHLGIRVASEPHGYVDPLRLLPGRPEVAPVSSTAPAGTATAVTAPAAPALEESGQGSPETGGRSAPAEPAQATPIDVASAPAPAEAPATAEPAPVSEHAPPEQAQPGEAPEPPTAGTVPPPGETVPASNGEAVVAIPAAEPAPTLEGELVQPAREPAPAIAVTEGEPGSQTGTGQGLPPVQPAREAMAPTPPTAAAPEAADRAVDILPAATMPVRTVASPPALAAEWSAGAPAEPGRAARVEPAAALGDVPGADRKPGADAGTGLLEGVKAKPSGSRRPADRPHAALSRLRALPPAAAAAPVPLRARSVTRSPESSRPSSVGLELAALALLALLALALAGGAGRSRRPAATPQPDGPRAGPAAAELQSGVTLTPSCPARSLPLSRPRPCRRPSLDEELERLGRHARRPSPTALVRRPSRTPRVPAGKVERGRTRV